MHKKEDKWKWKESRQNSEDVRSRAKEEQEFEYLSSTVQSYGECRKEG